MSKALFDLSETLRHSEDISSKLDSMEKEYREKRFGTLQNYKEYVTKNYKEL